MSSGRAVVSAWAASARAAVAFMNSAIRSHERTGSVLVTGSSGKGTTSRMLAEVLRAARISPIFGAEGGHSWSAVASALIENAEAGRTRGDQRAIKLVEVKPAALPQVVRRGATPTALVVTNIFGQPGDDGASAALLRQLERGIRDLPANTTLILNADDPRVAELARDAPNPRVYFGVSDPVHARLRPDPAAAVSCCPRCGDRLSYARVYYGHLGHWTCGGCGLGRPEPDVSVTKIVVTRSSATRVHVAANSSTADYEVPLPGMYNVYNALAAVAVGTRLDLPTWSLRAIENVSGAPMRMEKRRVAGHDVYLAVASNATAYTEVLRAIMGDAEPRQLVLGLSTQRHPRQDTSWIWDVDFEGLAGLAPAPLVCGNRAAEIGIRVKYAGWLGDFRDHGGSAIGRIEPDPVRAVRRALAESPPGEPVWIVSTATALAEIRRWLHHHDGDIALEAKTVPRPTGRLTVRRSTAPRPTGPRPSRPQPTGPQPSGPPRSAPQPAPPAARYRPDRRARPGWTLPRRPRQTGAAR